MTIHGVLGAGAVGHLVSSLLTVSGQANYLIHRNHENKSSEKLVLFHQGSSAIKINVKQVMLEAASNFDVLWVTVKSYQLEQALQQLININLENTKIILLQNGMGNLELANQILHEKVHLENIMVGSNTHGALLKKETTPIEIFHTGLGKIAIGENYCCSGKLSKPQFIDALPDSFNCNWHTNIIESLWLKLGINAVINPVTAYYQCKNGDLLTNQDYKHEIDLLISEVIEFYKIKKLPELADIFSKECYKVIEATAENYSSMMLDHKKGCKTEIDAITGYLLNEANRFRLHLSQHQLQYHRLLNP